MQRAGLITPLPFGGQGSEIPYSDTGAGEGIGTRFVSLIASTSDGYFEAMQADVIEGRTFEDSDWNRTDIAVIDDIAAGRLFPGERAVGRRLWIPSTRLEVV